RDGCRWKERRVGGKARHRRSEFRRAAIARCRRIDRCLRTEWANGGSEAVGAVDRQRKRREPIQIRKKSVELLLSLGGQGAGRIGERGGARVNTAVAPHAPHG